MHHPDDTLQVPLPRRPHGIETFRVAGTIEDEPVHAQWDGRWVRVSTLLFDQVQLVMAIDDALAEAGMITQFEQPVLRRSPEEFMLAVLTCCDGVDLAEFEIGGHRRVIAPNAGDSVPRFHED